MAMQWFRFYAGVLNDRKVQTMPPELFKLWVNLLCIANDGTPRGHIDGDLDGLAWDLRMAPEEVQSGLKRLVAAGLIEPDGDGYVPHNWAARQPARDDTAARVREHRSRYADPDPDEAGDGEPAPTERVTPRVTERVTERVTP